MKRGDRCKVLARVRVRVVGHFLELCAPADIAILVQNLKMPIERRVKKWIIRVDPGARLRRPRNGQGGETRGRRAGLEDRQGLTWREVEFLIEELENVQGGDQVLRGARDVRLCRHEPGGRNSALVIGNLAVWE